MQLPSYLHWYKKPSYTDVHVYGQALVDRAGSASNEGSPRNSLDSKRSNNDVPKRISLERILQNRTCSPMSLYDFYMYLKYIEHSSENLEFHAW